MWFCFSSWRTSCRQTSAFVQGVSVASFRFGPRILQTEYPAVAALYSLTSRLAYTLFEILLVSVLRTACECGDCGSGPCITCWLHFSGLGLVAVCVLRTDCSLRVTDWLHFVCYGLAAFRLLRTGGTPLVTNCRHSACYGLEAPCISWTGSISLSITASRSL